MMESDTILEEGVYTLKVVSVRPEQSHLDDSHVFIVELENEQLDQSAFLYAADNEVSRTHIWGDMVERFEDLPSIEGNIYLFPIRVVKLIGGMDANSVRSPLAEITRELGEQDAAFERRAMAGADSAMWRDHARKVESDTRWRKSLRGRIKLAILWLMDRRGRNG